MSSGLESKFEFISLDLETTGFSPSACDIIEIGAWHFKDGVAVSTFKRLVRPVRYVPMQVQQLTGITNEMLSDADTIDNVLPEFIDFCGSHWFLGYNLSFDYNFLVFKSRALGLDITMNGQRKGVDVLKVVREKSNFKSNNLGDVATSLGVLTDGKLHRADYDAYITKLVYDRYEKYKDVVPTYLDKSRYGSPLLEDTLDFE